MIQPLRVLMVEDCENDALLLLRELNLQGFSTTCERVEDPVAMTKALDEASWDIVLSDYAMPHFSAPEALRVVQEKGVDLPFVVISGTVGETTAVETMKAGAHDYLMKGELQRLGEAIRRELAAARVRAARRITEEELLRVNQVLRASEERFRGVFQGVTDGILLADENRSLVMANHAMCDMLGYTDEELIRLSVHDIYPEKDLPMVEAAFAEHLSGRTPLASDIPVKRKNGTVFFVDVKATKIVIDDRLLLMGCFRDVTENRRLRAAMAQSDQLASMGMLAAGVAHEINNPLSYILYNLESLSADLPSFTGAMKRCYSTLRDKLGPEDLKRVAGGVFNPVVLEDVLDRLREALIGTYRVKDIARCLGTFSHVDRDHLSNVDLEYAIDYAINLSFNEIKYRAGVVRDFGRVPDILASDGLISQVFLNLLVNAAHAIDDGDVAHNEIRVRTWVEGNEVFISVSDTGKGILPENMDKLFEPFFTTKGVGVGSGSGLGLAICRNIVTGFGGYIAVESEVGHGSKFTVRFPLPIGTQARRREEQMHD